jgi:hypothetical protein
MHESADFQLSGRFPENRRDVVAIEAVDER